MIDTLAQAAASMNGVLHGNDREFTGVSTDTRSLRENELFFALEGPNFDGCDYVDAAGASGAAGAVVKRKVDATLTQITVDDARLALGRLAAAWRHRIEFRAASWTLSGIEREVRGVRRWRRAFAEA